MSNFLSVLHSQLIQASVAILDSLSRANYTPAEGTNFSTKSILESFLSNQNFNLNAEITETQLHNSIKNFALACALLSSSQSSTHELLSWIPNGVCVAANSAFDEFSRAYSRSGFGERNGRRVSELFGLDSGLVSEEKRLVVEFMPEVLPSLRESIKESCIDKDVDGDEVSAASARAPVGFAIVAAYQFRWFVTQVDYPHLGKLCTLVIPCGLTALDHWSSEVKGQGMTSCIHLARNVNTTELSWYEDVILDACCQNIASADEIWSRVVEMSVILVTYIQQSNPRSPWFERILNEMLDHLECQPRNKDRRMAWLTFVEPLFHAVLKRLQTVIMLTWIRSTPYIERLIEELVLLYKEAALRTAREEIRRNVLEMLILLQQCNGLQFESTWDKHKNDPNLTALNSSLRGNSVDHVESHAQNRHLQEGSQLLRT